MVCRGERSLELDRGRVFEDVHGRYGCRPGLGPGIGKRGWRSQGRVGREAAGRGVVRRVHSV
jgi:hypothetical protein